MYVCQEVFSVASIAMNTRTVCTWNTGRVCTSSPFDHISLRKEKFSPSLFPLDRTADVRELQRNVTIGTLIVPASIREFFLYPLSSQKF